MMFNGLDVSHHNDIDWSAIGQLALSQNLYFAFCKASEGITHGDLEFANNRTGSRSAGLLSGAYHFFLPTSDPVAQADLLIAQIGTLAPGELPPVVDIEWTLIPKGTKGGRPELWKDLKGKERIAVTKTFLDSVEARLGIKPIIYTAHAFWQEFFVAANAAADLAFFAQYPLWIVNLNNKLNIPKPFARATFVQNHFGELAPKNASAFEKLDHDFFNGNLFGLLALMTPGRTFDRNKKNTPLSAIVRDFQQVLKAGGFYSSTLDGDFGKNTEKAVKDFQLSAGLTDTGVIDESTWKLLLPVA